ncbi:Protein pob1 [Escovopsis weberi]|uniref:Protein pob1 n=1 Tax=Escovopsis weberi TaxID=150374 RepID=A0A0M9VTM0_ESCWE|nr:Protein pob1 [Escovopsis weberi]
MPTHIRIMCAPRLTQYQFNSTQDYASFQSGESWSYREMRQKEISRDTFFSLKHEPQQFRPISVATEFVDTDWDEEEDIESDPEENSPRASLQSVPLGFVDTPAQSQSQSHFSRRGSPSQYTDAKLDLSGLPSWTPYMVAQSMLNSGIDPAVSERFILNDINGEILITLKFEDLRELDIHSFGIRKNVWQQIQALKDSQTASPRPPTPIEDAPSREAQREVNECNDATTRRDTGRRRRQPTPDDTVTPMESVSIIGIEQVIPKPHSCPKGENCSKWKKQQRLIEDFRKANPHIDMNASGAVMIYGDAGNPETARALNPHEIAMPFSSSVPSMVASSDVMGPGGLTPLQYYQETALRQFQAARDPQEGVRQFLNFHNQLGDEIPLTPPFEMTSTGQPLQGLRHLPKLSIPEKPQIARPRVPSRVANSSPQPPQPPQPNQPLHHHHQPQPQQRQSSPLQHEFVPYRMEKGNPLSPELETTQNPYRFGTPFSEFDVPVTSVPLGPVARETSQSVPPDMNYRMPSNNGHFRSQSRASGRRPSFVVLPSLDENKPAGISPKSTTSSSSMTTTNTTSPRTASPKFPSRPQQTTSTPAQAPPRFNYPWSPERTAYEQAVPPMAMLRSSSAEEARTAANGTSAEPANPGVTFQGPMKKRKTRMLRHEWQDGYFSLKGTRLNMHKDAQQMDRTLEYVDIDDYAIACSSAASTSKLSAAFKAVTISHDRKKSDPVGAFSFQLIPQDKNSLRFRKRESSISGPAGAPAEGVNGTGKTHHFAVKSRDDRIDWMRELMLAKAHKQKGEGFEISVNGNMI